MMTDSKRNITLEAFKVLVEQTEIKFLPDELEQLYLTYEALERLKALVRKPLHPNSALFAKRLVFLQRL